MRSHRFPAMKVGAANLAKHNGKAEQRKTATVDRDHPLRASYGLNHERFSVLNNHNFAKIMKQYLL